jgi:hypothetical protein
MNTCIDKIKNFAMTICKGGYDFTVAKAWLEKMNFISLDEGTFYEGFVDSNYEFVVKLIIQRENQHKDWRRGRAVFPSLNHPVSEYFLYPLFYTPKKEVIIQPYVETKDQDKAYEMLSSVVDKYFDFYECNVGWYNEQAVIFDYMNLEWCLNEREERKIAKIDK